MSEKDRGHVSKVRMLYEPRQGYDRLPLGEFFNLDTFWRSGLGNSLLGTG